MNNYLKLLDYNCTGTFSLSPEFQFMLLDFPTGFKRVGAAIACFYASTASVNMLVIKGAVHDFN